MNRLFGGKNAKRQQTLIQHSLLDDDDDEDPFDNQTRGDGVAVYRPPPTSLLPEELQKEVAVVQSSPKAKSRVVVDRYKSSDNISPSKLSVPLSPKQTIEKFQRRFSSPDRKPQIPTAATNGKVSMIQNLRDRMKFGIGGHSAATTTTNNDNASPAILEPPSDPLTPPFSDLFSEPFSEPFNALPDKEGDKVAPASEAFTVSCTSEELDRMFQGSLNRQQKQSNDENVAPEIQQRPKLKFSISSEPLPKPHTTTTAAKLNAESKCSEDISAKLNVDSNDSNIEALNDIVLPGRKEDASSGKEKEAVIVKEEKMPEKPSMIASVPDDEPTPEPKRANIDSNEDTATNIDSKKRDGVKEASRVNKCRGPSSKSPQKRSSVRESSDPSRSKTPESRPTSKKGLKTPTKQGKTTITINDEADSEEKTTDGANVPISRELKKSGSRDLAPKTPKRTKSSDDTMEFGIEHDKTLSKSDKKEDSKKSSSSKDGGVINSKEEKKETRKSSKHKESKSSKKDDKSKPAHDKKHSCASPTKSKESSKGKTKEKSSKLPTTPVSPKPSSSPGKSKRRNSTNTNSIPIENGDLTRNSGMNERAERRNSTGFVQAIPATLQIQKVKDKRRNSCTSIVSTQVEATTPIVGQDNAQTIILPDVLQINDDVPPWVKAAMHMIEQYQKNKQYSPAMDPVANLISNTNILPIVERDTLPKQQTNKPPVRKDSVSDDSSSYSTCSSDSDDREGKKEEDARKWVPIISIEKVSGEAQVDDIPETKTTSLAVAENVEKESNVKEENKGKLSSSPRSNVNGQETEMPSSSPKSEEGASNTKTNLPPSPISKDNPPHQPNHSRANSTSVELKAPGTMRELLSGAIEQKGIIGVEHMADLESSRSITPHRGMVRNASTGPKISLHSTSLLKRDITPSQRRPVAGSNGQVVSNHTTIDSSVNAASSKEKFRELRRLARKAANEPVSSDDDCDDHKVNHDQLQRPIRAGGRKSSMRINNESKTIPDQVDILPSNSKGSDAIEGKAYGIDSTHESSTSVSLDVNSTKTKQERRGSAAFQKLLRIAQRTANEPLDDETLPNNGDQVNPIKVEEQVVEEATSKPTTTKIRPTPNRAKSKSFENIPSIQQRKQILFEK